MPPPPSILILGGSGYVGEAFVRETTRRGWEPVVVRRRDVDYTRFPDLLGLLRSRSWSFLVNCAGYTGKPNVDACEEHRAETLLGNALLPQTVANACDVAGLPWGHVSSGCIFTGAKIREADGSVRIEPDLTRPEARRLAAENPGRLLGFTESDPPNFSFRSPPCSFYSGSKALGEEAMAGAARCYLWRLRIPFDGIDNSRNYLSKLQRYSRVYDNLNSLSHLGDFARACLDLRDLGAPHGTYNVTNPGFVSARDVVQRIQRYLQPGREFTFWKDDEEFYRVAARTPRSNCILDPAKLLATGVKMRPVEDAIDESLRHWVLEP